MVLKPFMAQWLLYKHAFYLDCSILEDATDRLPQNVSI